MFHSLSAQWLLVPRSRNKSQGGDTIDRRSPSPLGPHATLTSVCLYSWHFTRSQERPSEVKQEDWRVNLDNQISQRWSFHWKQNGESARIVSTTKDAFAML